MAAKRIRARVAAAAAALAAAALLLSGCTGGVDDSLQSVTIGLITKQEENPYWIEVREVAERAAADEGASLISATGESDIDVEGQTAALREMIEAGVDGILIAPTDSSALNPVIEEARAVGIVVIALDTPVEPLDAVDAYFATDNVEAGRLAGSYAAAKARELGIAPKIATLDLAPGIVSGEDRHLGFLEGFGLQAGDEALVASVDTEGDRELGEAAMTEILSANPDVNVIYTVNEQAALGALTVLKAKKMNLDEMVIVSIDGGCQAIKGPVRDGEIDATVQQFPQNMAREGVRAVVAAVREGVMPSGFLDTGVQLITDDPVDGVESRDVAFGVRNCWGS